MTAEQLALDCNPNWTDDEYDEPPDPRLHDLRGQGLTLVQLHTITDVPTTGSYL